MVKLFRKFLALKILKMLDITHDKERKRSKVKHQHVGAICHAMILIKAKI